MSGASKSMSMLIPERRAPAAHGDNPELDEEEINPKPEKTMEDLPPEVLTKILEHATLNEARKNMLVYRLVNSQWKDIVDSLFEKEVITRRLEVFPEMKIAGQSSDQLCVVCPPTIFPFGENPFPSNSLLLRGKYHLRRRTSTGDTLLTLPIFMLTFGSNLTTFALHNQIICSKSVAAMLQSMENLKVLCFKDVELTPRSIGAGWSLLPPPLPSLTTLELRSQSGFSVDLGDSRNALYVWLIASYADQLVCLNLDAGDPFPALQRGHQYSIPHRRGKRLSIATTSDSAFGKLKELTVDRPSPQFLRLTETPALFHLSITGWYRVDLRDLAKLIEKCGSTLRKVSVSVAFGAVVPDPGRLLLTAGVVARNVKTLTVPCPTDCFEDTMLSKDLLLMFPALSVLQLTHYRFDLLGYKMATYEGENQAVPAGGIIFLTERLASLWKQQLDIRRGDRGHAYEIAIGIERAAILKRLISLGENVNKVLVELMLEQQGIWNTCPKLKIVSVSLYEKPVGDVCVIRRMDDT